VGAAVGWMLRGLALSRDRVEDGAAPPPVTTMASVISTDALDSAEGVLHRVFADGMFYVHDHWPECLAPPYDDPVKGAVGIWSRQFLVCRTPLYIRDKKLSDALGDGDLDAARARAEKEVDQWLGRG
jgi:hypothetical protein